MTQADIYNQMRGAFPNAAQVGVKFVDDAGTYAAWYEVRAPRDGEGGDVTVTVEAPERVK